MRPPLSLRADGVTLMAMYCAVGAIRWVMADDGVRQPPKGGCIIVAPGWLAYLGLVVERKNKI